MDVVCAGQTAAFCAAHKLDGMVNNRHRMCAFPGCVAHATFKNVGNTHPTFCGTHRTDGMVQVRATILKEASAASSPYSLTRVGSLCV